MPKVAVIANRGSGPGGEPDLAAIREAFRTHGLTPLVAAVDGDRLTDQAREAIKQGADVLVAAGGDGTVSALAGVAVAHGVPLAVLPLGTLNHFAKDAGLPLKLEDAVRVAATGALRPTDVGQVADRVFVNNASIGLYPSVVRERERRQAAGASKGLATVGAAATVLRQVPAHHLRLTLDGTPHQRSTSFLFVGNNPYVLSGPGLGKRDSLHDGVLSVYTMRRPGRRVALRLAAQALLGRLEQAPDFESAAAKRLQVDAAAASLRLGIDGEAVRLPTPLRFRARPRALRLVAPA